MHFKLHYLVIVVTLGLIFTACGGTSPQITAEINAQGTTIIAGEKKGLSVNVLSSPDIQYEWNTTGGTLSDQSSQSVIFTAPEVAGPVNVDVTITSGGQVATDSITFDVIILAPTETSTPEPSLTPKNTSTPTNTPIPTNTSTPPPTFTPTPIPNPIKCDDSEIVPGIFPLIADKTTFSFTGSSENAAFECEGVFDIFNPKPPAIRIDYKAITDTSSFFSMGFSEDFDVSDFSEICILVFAEESGQKFDLKLENMSYDQGININTTKNGEWEGHCVSLEGYSEINLKKIKVITLSFNNSFGDATIWVDGFELR